MAHPFIPATGVLMCRLYWNNGGEPAQNYFFIKRTLYNWDSSYVNTRHTAMMAWWNVYLQPYVSQDCNLYRIDYTDLTNTTAYRVTKMISPAQAGASTGDMMPQNCTPCVRWVTNQRGRSYTGRTYMVGLPDAFQAKGILLPSVQTNLISIWGQFITAHTAAPVYPVVCSFKSGGSWRASAVSTQIISCMIDPDLDSQRNRLPGR